MQNDQQDLISIVMAAWNNEKYIEAQLISIFEQDYENWELIITDDASTDETHDLVSKVIQSQSTEIKSKITLIKNKTNMKLPKVYELGLKTAKGKYIAFADADDVWLQFKLSSSLKKLKETNSVLVYTDLRVVDQNLNVIHESFIKNMSILQKSDSNLFNTLLRSNHITGCTMLFDKKLVDYIFPMSNAVYHDYWTALIASAVGEIAFFDKSTILYRQHSQNLIGSSLPTIPSLLKVMLAGHRLSFLNGHHALKYKTYQMLIDLTQNSIIKNSIYHKCVLKKLSSTKFLLDFLQLLIDKKGIMQIMRFYVAMLANYMHGRLNHYEAIQVTYFLFLFVVQAISNMISNCLLRKNETFSRIIKTYEQ